MSDEDIITNLTRKLEQAEADKQAAIELHITAFAKEIWSEQLKHYKSQKVMPLTMANKYILKVSGNHHGQKED